MPRAAGVSTVPAEPLLVDSPADEVWADQGLADIESLLLSDEDGDEAHEFIVIDALPRSDSAKGAHRPACGSHLLSLTLHVASQAQEAVSPNLSLVV